MTKIFLTGASGYIGGEVLYLLRAQSAAKHQITCLVRDQAKASRILEVYPDVRTVEGDLDNTDLVETESKNADIVLSLASTKHAPSSKAIASGLSTSGRDGPGYWIQMSGASLFSGPDIKANTYGESGGKIYDDIADQDEIWSMVQQAPTRVVEQLVLAQDASKVKTALIIGPMIYGAGRGPINQRSIQLPDIARYTLKTGKAYQVGSGQAMWSSIHVCDIAANIVALVDAAVAGKSSMWNRDGVYCPENGGLTFGELAALISRSAKSQGYVTEEGVESFTAEQMNQHMPHGSILMGTNAKQKASRARKLLGWTPSGVSLSESIPAMLKSDAALLGK